MGARNGLDHQEISQLLIGARERSGLTLEDAAQKLHIPTSALPLIEQDPLEAPHEIVMRVMNFYDLASKGAIDETKDYVDNDGFDWSHSLYLLAVKNAVDARQFSVELGTEYCSYLSTELIEMWAKADGYTVSKAAKKIVISDIFISPVDV